MTAETSYWIEVLRNLDVEEIVSEYGEANLEDYQQAKKENRLQYIKYLAYTSYNTEANINYIIWLDSNLENEERDLFSKLATMYLYLKIGYDYDIPAATFIRYIFELVSEYDYAWLTNKYMSFSSRKRIAKKLKRWCEEINKLLLLVDVYLNTRFYFIRYINGSELTICFE